MPQRHRGGTLETMPTTAHAQRTPHNVHAHNPKAPPVWGDGADGAALGSGGRAAQSDRDDRRAWGVVLRSAYLSRVKLPETVAAGDRGQALAILGRIDECLAEVGRWTRLERRRLRAMRAAWARRASGGDVAFQMVGWVRRVGRGEAERRAADRQEARGMAKVFEGVWEVMGK